MQKMPKVNTEHYTTETITFNIKQREQKEFNSQDSDPNPDLPLCYTWLRSLAPGDSERQGSLACCSPWGRKAEQLIDKTSEHLGVPPLFETE